MGNIVVKSDLSDATLLEKFPNRSTKQKIFANATLQTTIDKMRLLIKAGRADQKVVYLVRIIARDLAGRDFDGIAHTIYNWIVDRVKYQRDPEGVEWLQDVEVTLRMKTGDCDDFTVLGASMLGALGIKSRIKIAKAGAPVWNHVYLEYYSPKRGIWVPFDASEKKYVGWEAENIQDTRVYTI